VFKNKKQNAFILLELLVALSIVLFALNIFIVSFHSRLSAIQRLEQEFAFIRLQKNLNSLFLSASTDKIELSHFVPLKVKLYKDQAMVEFLEGHQKRILFSADKKN
jgi:type II secretory pathway pseudopilin PulG